MRTILRISVVCLVLTGCSRDESAGPAALEPEPVTETTPAAMSIAEKPDNSLMRVISGEVWYRERMALPPGAEVIVTLEDQSRADAPATVITDYTHIVDGQGAPYSFRLVYDPAAIDERMTYGLRARIEHDGELLFSSTEHIDPFAGNSVRIMVSRQGGNRTDDQVSGN